MYFKQILNERCGCASYVIASRKTSEAAVVDPARDTEPYAILCCESVNSGCGTSAVDTHISCGPCLGRPQLGRLAWGRVVPA